MKITKPKSSRQFVGPILVILIILAALAAIVLPRISVRGEGAREKAAKMQIVSLSAALDMFQVDNGYYPNESNTLEVLVVKPREATNWKGPYLHANKIPPDPWNNPYVYEFPGKHNPASFDLYSTGKDGKSWIGNWDN